MNSAKRFMGWSSTRAAASSASIACCSSLEDHHQLVATFVTLVGEPGQSRGESIGIGSQVQAKNTQSRADDPGRRQTQENFCKQRQEIGRKRRKGLRRNFGKSLFERTTLSFPICGARPEQVHPGGARGRRGRRAGLPWAPCPVHMAPDGLFLSQNRFSTSSHFLG